MDIHPSISKILNSPKISQRTPEWFEYRNTRVTASECSTVLAQGRGAKSLMLRKKCGGTGSHFSTEYTRIGSENEEEVVKKYKELYPDVIVYHDLSIIPHPTESYIAASLDACTNTGINVEIKTCFKDKFVPVSKAYRDQVQLQMEVADLEITHLVQQYYNIPGRPIKVHEILRDRDWFKRSAPIFKNFVDEMISYFPFDMIIVKYQLAKIYDTSKYCNIEEYISEEESSMDLFRIIVQMDNTIDNTIYWQLVN